MIAAPEAIAAAATDLASIGSTIGAANAAAAANTTAVLAAGADQVSVAIAAAFGAHGQAYQALSAQAARRDQRALPGGVGAPADR
ncbi:PE-PGRS family protein [Mycobacterium tuberculosis]|nr:PE-PGRS family protein [Mycobacterium tuberculosis]